MPKIVCVKCHLDYQPLRIGVQVVDMGFDPPAPYRILNGDALICPGCGHRIIAGFPLDGHYHHRVDFEDEVKRVRESGAYRDGLSIEVYEHVKDVPHEF